MSLHKVLNVKVTLDGASRNHAEAYAQRRGIPLHTAVAMLVASGGRRLTAARRYSTSLKGHLAQERRAKRAKRQRKGRARA